MTDSTPLQLLLRPCACVAKSIPRLARKMKDIKVLEFECDITGSSSRGLVSIPVEMRCCILIW